MKILLLWHDLPSPYTGDSLPIYNLFKYLGQKHNITLLSFKQVTEESRYRYDLNRYYKAIETQDITEAKSPIKRIIRTFANILSPTSLFSAKSSFIDFYYSHTYYSPGMQLKIKNLLTTTKFDLIYTSLFMAFYVQDVDLPKVVHEYDCVTEMNRQKYLSMKNLVAKFFYWLVYLRMRRYERNISNKFDVLIVVSPQEQKTVQSLFPSANALVVPNGVDTEFFRPGNEQEEYASLIFVGSMSYQPNIDAMLYFCSRIYAKIKENVPGTKLHIVGRDPTKEIQGLSSDKSVVVTGYVEDVRPYLARASVVLAPFVSGTTGIKNKVLEAMAMAKPVVSTSMGVQGITLATNDHVIIADEPDEFAGHVVKLLCDKQLRQKIGHNARKLVESSYSWESMAEQLNEVITKAHDKRHE